MAKSPFAKTNAGPPSSAKKKKKKPVEAQVEEEPVEEAEEAEPENGDVAEAEAVPGEDAEAEEGEEELGAEAEEGEEEVAAEEPGAAQLPPSSEESEEDTDPGASPEQASAADEAEDLAGSAQKMNEALTVITNLMGKILLMSRQNQDILSDDDKTRLENMLRASNNIRERTQGAATPRMVGTVPDAGVAEAPGTGGAPNV